MNAAQLQKNASKYEKNVRRELENLSSIVSQINLKKFQNEDASKEMKRYKKSVANYEKSLNGMKTTLKFLKAQDFMSVEDILDLENLLKKVEKEFEETTRYVNMEN